MTKLFRIALVQKSAVPLDERKNLRLAVKACREAKQLGADLVLFPEMWSTAYAFPEREDEAAVRNWYSHATPETGEYVETLRQTARELELGVCATCMSEGDPAPQNTAYLIGPDGTLLLKYSKVHTCDFGSEGLLLPGNEFRVCDFPLPDGGSVALGVMICYDREYPESARILMLKGAEILLVPNACDMNHPRLAQLSTRAFENMVGVAMANYPGELHGNSCAYSPVVFSKSGVAVDNTIAMAGHTEETICMAQFDLEELREYRSRECWGNTYRKSGAYDKLLTDEVQPPFRRSVHNRAGIFGEKGGRS
ncbi:MAG: carbon-nitrogen hydrolase family protein [Oscillospiraceae bacterium]|jgi:predicted amidohydrolase